MAKRRKHKNDAKAETHKCRKESQGRKKLQTQEQQLTNPQNRCKVKILQIRKTRKTAQQLRD